MLIQDIMQELISFMQESIVECIKIQEDLDLDVLVHGDPERNDMVQYFGELLSGFAFTSFGWVQSYGTLWEDPFELYLRLLWQMNQNQF